MDERDDAERVIRVMAEFYDPAHNEYAIPVTQRVMRRLAAEFGYVDNNEARRMRGEIGSLQAENAKMRERIAELEELLPENGRWFSAEVVEAYATECRALKALAAEMLGEHQRIYDGDGLLYPTGATDGQMARWRSECERWGIEEYE